MNFINATRIEIQDYLRVQITELGIKPLFDSPANDVRKDGVLILCITINSS